MSEIFLTDFKNIPKKLWGLFFSREFISYFCVGAAATFVDWFLVFFITDVLDVWYVVSVSVGYVGGMLTNYFLNRKYTFKNNSKKIARQLLIFQIVAGVGFLLNLGIVVLLVEYAAIWYMLAKVISTGVVLIWNFLGHKYITFRVV